MKIFICASKYNYKYVTEIAKKLKKTGHRVSISYCVDYTSIPVFCRILE